MNVDLTKPQAELFQSTATATCAVAGFGSGKSQSAMYRMISTMLTYPDANMLYSAPTIPLIRDILWEKLDEFLPQMGLKYHINKSESIVYIHDHGSIYCRSMDNPARLVGFEVVDAFMDELDILPEDKALEVFRKIKARCRQSVYTPGKKKKKKNRKRNQQFVTTTPEGFKATYKLFKKNPIPDSHLVQMSTYSNPFLDEDYITDLKNSYPPQLIEAYLEGNFVNLVALPVWGAFDPDSNSIATPDNKVRTNEDTMRSAQKYLKHKNQHMEGSRLSSIVQTGEDLHIGTDFNVGRGCGVIYVTRTLPNNHPASPYNQLNPNFHAPKTVKEHQDLANGWEIMIGVGEVYNTFDTPDTIRALDEIAPADKFPNRYVYPDASGASRKSVNATISDIYLLKQNDFKVRKRLKNPSIKDRVASANAAFCNGFGHRRLYLDTNVTPNFKDSLIQQVYDDNGLPKKGRGEFDDMSDAGTYPVFYRYPLKHQRMHTRELEGV